jgi:hypothetical protein
MEKQTKLNVGQKLAVIQTNLKAAKGQRNTFGKYNYRSAEDVLEALKPHLKELECYVTINEKLLPNDRIQSTAKLFCAITGAYIKATSIVGVDLDQKGMATAQQFGSASSYGKKYALGNLFLIDDTKDADATNTHNTTLSKPELVGDAIAKAQAFIKGGGNIETIRSKYTISAKVMKDLQSIQKGY